MIVVIAGDYLPWACNVNERLFALMREQGPWDGHQCIQTRLIILQFKLAIENKYPFDLSTNMKHRSKVIF